MTIQALGLTTGWTLAVTLVPGMIGMGAGSQVLGPGQCPQAVARSLSRSNGAGTHHWTHQWQWDASVELLGYLREGRGPERVKAPPPEVSRPEGLHPVSPFKQQPNKKQTNRSALHSAGWWGSKLKRHYKSTVEAAGSVAGDHLHPRAHAETSRCDSGHTGARKESCSPLALAQPCAASELVTLGKLPTPLVSGSRPQSPCSDSQNL